MHNVMTMSLYHVLVRVYVRLAVGAGGLPASAAPCALAVPARAPAVRPALPRRRTRTIARARTRPARVSTPRVALPGAGACFLRRVSYPRASYAYGTVCVGYNSCTLLFSPVRLGLRLSKCHATSTGTVPYILLHRGSV